MAHRHTRGAIGAPVMYIGLYLALPIQHRLHTSFAFLQQACYTRNVFDYVECDCWEIINKNRGKLWVAAVRITVILGCDVAKGWPRSVTVTIATLTLTMPLWDFFDIVFLSFLHYATPSLYVDHSFKQIKAHCTYEQGRSLGLERLGLETVLGRRSHLGHDGLENGTSRSRDLRLVDIAAYRLIGNANSAFQRLDCIWRQKSLGLPIVIRLHESVIMVIFQYRVEAWSVTDVNRAALLLEIWNFKENNWTRHDGSYKRWLCWFGHVQCLRHRSEQYGHCTGSPMKEKLRSSALHLVRYGL